MADGPESIEETMEDILKAQDALYKDHQPVDEAAIADALKRAEDALKNP